MPVYMHKLCLTVRKYAKSSVANRMKLVWTGCPINHYGLEEEVNAVAKTDPEFVERFDNSAFDKPGSVPALPPHVYARLPYIIISEDGMQDMPMLRIS